MSFFKRRLRNMRMFSSLTSLLSLDVDDGIERNSASPMAQVKDLQEFLVGAELQHYYNNFVKDLKVNTVPQLKYVEDEDLMGVGMTKPEIRRLRQFFKKECPKGALNRLKKILAKGQSDGVPNSPTSQEKHLHLHASASSSSSSSKHIIPEDAITLHKTLGTGEFGVVQQGVWTNESGEQVMVAVKCLSKAKLQSEMSNFLQESSIMHSIDHPNIVQLFGIVLSSDSLMLVTELASLRSLLECIREPALRSSFSVSVLCDLCVQIACGMSYLESRRLIHRDLAARNVLVFAKDKIKISDFGLSRALGIDKDYYQSHMNASLKLPIAWCSPECVNYLRFTSSSDVWSFGVTVWEMFSYGLQPWNGLTGLEIIQSVDAPTCRRLSQPDSCPDDWFGVLLQCWHGEPNDRPKFSELHATLQQIKPFRVIATADISNEDSANAFLAYKTNDIITILSKMPEKLPRPGLWKGVIESNGEVGYFDAIHFSPYIEINPSNAILRKAKVNRTGSGRNSVRSTKRLTPSMISNPQNDLRHIGHVGYDGAVFGDVSFIGDNYDKLPIKVGNTRKSCEDITDMSSSYPVIGQPSHFVPVDGSLSSITLNADGTKTTTASTSSDFDDFADFKLPDFSSGFDLGSSLMDEVMKALGSTSSDDGMNFLLADYSSSSPSSSCHPPNVASSSSNNHHEAKEVTNRPSVLPRAEQEESEEEEEEEEEEEDEEEEDDDEEEAKDGNNSIFESSSCSSKDVFDDHSYNELRKNSNLDKSSSSEKLFKDETLFSKSDEKLFDPSRLKSFSQKEEELMVETINATNADDSNKILSSNKGRFDGRKIEADYGLRGMTIDKSSSIEELDGGVSPEKNIVLDSSKGFGGSVGIGGSVGVGSTRTSSTGSAAGGIRIVRPNNQNIRAPQGIPGRKPFINPGGAPQQQGQGHGQDDDVVDDTEVDTNPLRRLRESQSGFARPMMTFRALNSATTTKSNGHNNKGNNISPSSESTMTTTAQSSQRNLNVNLSFFDKLKEQEEEKLS